MNTYEFEFNKGKVHMGELLIIAKGSQLSMGRLLDEINTSNKPWILTISKKKEKRSLNANSYLWVLCDKIARVLAKDDSAITKEDIYRSAIKDVGAFEIYLIPTEAVEREIERWNDTNGVGTFAELKCQSMMYPGFSEVIFYHGSSTYDREEMSRLIDFVISEAKELGIETRTPDEVEKMKALWGV